jgi:tape measure domain-containing protein
MANSVGNLAIVISGNANPFVKETARAEQEAQRFVGRIKAVGGGGGGGFGLTAAAVGLGTALGGGVLGAISAVKGGLAEVASVGLHAAEAAVKLAADYQDAAVAFEVMTGSAEKGKQLLDELQQFGARTTFGVGGATKAGEQLLAYGIDAGNVIPALNALGNVALGDGEKFDRLALAFGQVVAKGRLMGQELLQFTEAGVGVSEFAKTAGVSVAQLTAEMEAGKVGVDVMVNTFNRLTAEGGRFHGELEKRGETVPGQFRKLTGQLELLGKNVGLAFFAGFKPEELLAAAAAGVGKLAGKADGLTETFARLRKAADQVIPALAGGLAGAAAIGGTLLDPGKWDDSGDAVTRFAKTAVMGFAELSKSVTLLVLDVGILIARLEGLGDVPILKQLGDLSKGKIDQSKSPHAIIADALGIAEPEDFKFQLGPRVLGGANTGGSNDALLKSLIAGRDRVAGTDFKKAGADNFDAIQRATAEAIREAEVRRRLAEAGQKQADQWQKEIDAGALGPKQASPDALKFAKEAAEKPATPFAEFQKQAGLYQEAQRFNLAGRDQLGLAFARGTQDLLRSANALDVKLPAAMQANTQAAESAISYALTQGSVKGGADQVADRLKQIAELSKQQEDDLRDIARKLDAILAKPGGLSF